MMKRLCVSSREEEEEKEEEEERVLFSAKKTRMNELGVLAELLANERAKNAAENNQGVDLSQLNAREGVRKHVVDRIYARFEDFFLNNNTKNEREVQLSEADEFAAIDCVAAAIEYAEDVIYAFKDVESANETWIYEVLAASCFRVSLKMRQRRDRGSVEDERASVVSSRVIFDKENMSKMESVVLETLEYRVAKPTRVTWAKVFLDAIEGDVKVLSFGCSNTNENEDAFREIWHKAEKNACNLLLLSLRALPGLPLQRSSTLGAAAAAFAVSEAVLEILDSRGPTSEQQQKQHAEKKQTFVSGVKKLIKGRAITAEIFSSWELEFEASFKAFQSFAREENLQNHRNHHHRRRSRETVEERNKDDDENGSLRLVV
jgi:hypothetical protein